MAHNLVHPGVIIINHVGHAPLLKEFSRAKWLENVDL